MARIPAAVHDFPSRVFLQIAHAGQQTKPALCGCVPVSPSPVHDPVSKVTPRELAGEEIGTLVGDFISAAVRGKRAGFDGVQLHAAHGYLISGFLSPHTNRRTDEWGGPVENRARVLLEVLRGAKAACGRDFPVIVKLNSTDFLEGGLTPDDAVTIVMSDHGARPMMGGLCFNDWLIQEGYLVLKEPVREITPIAKADIDWNRTVAWGDGGYYGRCFLNH